MRTFCLHLHGPSETGWQVAVCEGPCRGDAAKPVGSIPAPLPTLLGREPGRAAQDAVLDLVDEEDPVTVDAVGRYLHDLLARGGATAAWQAALDADEPVRTLLHLPPADPDRSGADDPAALPWESLTRADDVRPFLSPRRPCVRVHTGAPLRPIALPVRVLVLVADRRQSAADLRPDEELDAILGAVAAKPGQWHVEWIDQPSRDDLAAAIGSMRPHVLHLIGHGARELGGPRRPCLTVWSREQQKE